MIKKIFVFLLSALLFITSCSLTNSISLDADTSGQNSLEIQTNDFFIGVVQDLSSWKEISEDPLMDTALESFVSQIEKSHYSQLVSVEKIDEYSYKIVFDFTSFSDFVLELSGLETQSLITLTNSGEYSKLSLNLNLDTYSELEKIVPFLADKNFAVYGPKYNQDVSQEDYLMMMDFIFGENASESIMNSEIIISVKLSEAVSNTNGTLVSSDSVCFELSLVDFLLLHNPVCYWVEF